MSNRIAQHDPNQLLLECAVDADMAEPDGVFVAPKRPPMVDDNWQSGANGHHKRNGSLKASEVLDEALAHDHDSERALLAAVIIDPGLAATAFAHVKPGAFHDETNKKIAAAVHVLHIQGAPITGNAIFEVLQGRGQAEEIGGKTWFAALLEEYANTANSEANTAWYANCVQRSYKLRMGRLALEQALIEISKPGADGALVADAGFRAVKDLSGASDAIDYGVMTSAELDAADIKVEYLIAMVLTKRQPFLLAGGKKTLKTLLLLAMGISVSTGLRFLGVFEVLQTCNVLLMSGESGLATLKESAQRIAKSMGTSLGECSRLYWADKLPQLDDPAHLEALRKLIRRLDIEVLAIDPAYLCIPGADAGNLMIIGAILRGISEMCQEEGVTLILAHHTKKGLADPYSPPELEDIAWAGFQEYARQWGIVSRRHKYEPGTGSHKLWWSVGGSAGHSLLRALDIEEGAYDGHSPRIWDARVMTVDEVREMEQEQETEAVDMREQTQREKNQQRILEALAKLSRGTEKDIRNTAGLSGQKFAPVWVDLLATGDILPDGQITKANKQRYDAYRLAGTPEHTQETTEDDNESATK
ncbi:MAG: AAA family ATPase [Pirellulales bacterium]|nr:AAA family ATPase [Pirellulales bacterium]